MFEKDENDLTESQDLPEGETGSEDEDFGEFSEETESDEAEEQLASEEETDQDETEEEEEAPEEEEESLKEESGNFDWKKINAKLGKTGSQLEKSFREAQKTVTKALTEKKELEKKFESFAPVQQEATLFKQFDNLVRSNPELRAAVHKAITGQAPSNPRDEFLKIPGVNPDDPLVPILAQQQQIIDELRNQHQGFVGQQQQTQVRETFRQGLLGAKDRFVELVGREPSEPELRAVAEKMRSTGLYQGADWVPGLFVEEIRKGATKQFFESRKAKKSLPKSPKTGLRQGKTSKGTSLKEAFESSWSEHGQDAE